MLEEEGSEAAVVDVEGAETGQQSEGVHEIIKAVVR